jgi:hypothetical protein
MDENVIDFMISVSNGRKASRGHTWAEIIIGTMRLITPVCISFTQRQNITASHAPHIPDADSTVLASSYKPFAIRVIRNSGDVLRMTLAYVDLSRVSEASLKRQKARTGVLAGLEISYTAIFL